MSSTGAAARDGRLQVGMRILEVNNHSLLGMTHTEAVRVLRAIGDSLVMLVCDGFDPRKVSTVEVRPWKTGGGNGAGIQTDSLTPTWDSQASPGTIANPFATGIVRKNSMESISSIDRDLSPEEMDIIQKVRQRTYPKKMFLFFFVLFHSTHPLMSIHLLSRSTNNVTEVVTNVPRENIL